MKKKRLQLRATELLEPRIAPFGPPFRTVLPDGSTGVIYDNNHAVIYQNGGGIILLHPDGTTEMITPDRTAIITIGQDIKPILVA